MAEGFSWTGGLTWTWNNRGEILGYLKKVREWFRSDPGGGILIIGAGGVGKSTLAALLSGEFDWLLSEPWRYDESFGIEQYTLKDDPKVSIVVPPGQHRRRETTWGEVQQNVAAGKYRGIIVVNANGYHAIGRQSYKAHRLYAGNKEDFLKAYLEANRQDEIAILRRLTPFAQTSSGKLGMLSMLSKEDLRWSERQQAEERYTTGDYSGAVAGVATAKGEQHFRHELVSGSLVISNFLTGEGELLQKNTEGYDHRRHVESLRRLFEVVKALMDWESGP